MRPIFRLSLFILALFLAVAPAMTFAQSAGTTGSTTTTTTGPAATGSSSSTMTTPNNSSATTNGSTTTTSTTTVPWVWLVVGAVVVVGIIAMVATNGRTNTRIVS